MRRSEEWAYVQISIASFLFKSWSPFLCTLHTDVKLKPSCESVAATKFSEIFSDRAASKCKRVIIREVVVVVVVVVVIIIIITYWWWWWLSS